MTAETRDPHTPDELKIPQLSLVVLIGASGSGKSTFAANHFLPTEVLSSDTFRGMVADDETDQSATAEAFDALHYIAGKRLTAGRLTVVDATNVQRHAREQLVALARAHDVLPVAIVLDIPEKICAARNEARADRDFGPHVVQRHTRDLRRSLKHLKREGFRTVHVLRGEDAVSSATIRRERLFNDLRHESGPFDVIGDVHGCRSELESLLDRLGYTIERDDAGRAVGAHHPERRAVFVGDLVDRGPDTPGVLRLVMGMVGAGDAFCVSGNHEAKLVRAMRGRKVQVRHGLAESLEQFAAETEEFRTRAARFMDGLIAHYVLDDGALVVSHAGIPEKYHGRASGRVRSFCLYGDTTGETDEYGLPVRLPWQNDYRGRAMVLYGHTPVAEAAWVNNTMCLDTGVVFGGKLSALRYPEREVVSVAAEREYFAPPRPLSVSDGGRGADVLDIKDVTGTRFIETDHQPRIKVPEENAAAALEVMSRFAMDPQWLVYLPPTMAPVATSDRPDLLEHPDQAFDQYRDDGVTQVVCEEKHMGSRAVVSVFRDDRGGAVWTRTGRPFFDDDMTERLIRQVRAAAEKAGLFDELEASWLLFDAELLPWSAKAGSLLRDQYAAVGAAARGALPAAVSALERAAASGLDVGPLLERTRSRATNADAYVESYRRYVWDTDGLDGVRLAPFQLLASGSGPGADNAAHHTRRHSWHLDLADRLVEADPETFTPTRRLYVDVTDPASRTAGVDWWTELTSAGGEGMVVKPADNLTRGKRGPVQPGLKVRGREYLRIIYGPDYTEPHHLDRLRKRGLGRKRSLAQREYALGLEALDRTARGEPLWRIHECVFAVLALESEPTDPRL